VEFLSLSGGADFYASDVDRLIAEGKTSFGVYLAICAQKRIEPYKAA
jgi:predicted HicB family RNase H-like nuclease